MSVWNEVSDRIKAWSGSWPGYVALGSFALYVMGYLALRFHLTALGIGTDLNVLDERYVFAGAKFLVYLFSCIPIILLLTLVPATIIYILYRILGAGIRAKVKSLFGRLFGWWSVPHRPALVGIIVSLILIQFVMRQCFLFSNLLLAPSLPGACWLRSLLLDERQGLQSLYFSGLAAGTLITGALFVAARSRTEQTSTSRFLTLTLALLLAIQFLFLPVNYGILISDKSLPKVTDLGGQAALNQGQEAWLVWEGNDGITYLVRSKDQNGEKRSLITLPRKDVKKTEILGYDDVLRILFSDQICSR